VGSGQDLQSDRSDFDISVGRAAYETRSKV
jgi:hypothetical protein